MTSSDRKENKGLALVSAFQEVRKETRRLQSQARKTNQALAKLDEELETRGIKLHKKGTE